MKIALTLLSFLFAFNAIAQDDTGQNRVQIEDTVPTTSPVRFSPMLGVAMFDLVGINEFESDAGATVGGLIDVDGKGLVYQTGLSYIQMGAKAALRNADFRVKLDYLALHAGGKYFLQEHHRGLFIKGALLPMVNVRNEGEIRYAGRTQKVRMNTQTADVLLQLGAGFETPATRTVGIGGELTFNRGLVNVNSSNGGEIFNQGFLLSGFVTL